MTSHTHAYLSRTAQGIVIAAVAVNDAGIRYEPDHAVRLPPNSTAMSIGQAIVDALKRYAKRDRNLRGHKKTEWPAYRASGLKSVRAFEEEFSYVAIERDERRLTLTRFEGNHAAVDTVHLPQDCPVEDVGVGLMKIAQKAGFHRVAEQATRGDVQ